MKEQIRREEIFFFLNRASRRMCLQMSTLISHLSTSLIMLFPLPHAHTSLSLELAEGSQYYRVAMCVELSRMIFFHPQASPARGGWGADG